jgi:hypothetical protein
MTDPATSLPRIGFDGSLSMLLAAPLLRAAAHWLHSTPTEVGPDNPQGRPAQWPLREHRGGRRRPSTDGWCSGPLPLAAPVMTANACPPPTSLGERILGMRLGV